MRGGWKIHWPKFSWVENFIRWRHICHWCHSDQWKPNKTYMPSRLLLCTGVKPPNESRGYETKQSDSEVPVMLKLLGMGSTPSLPLLPDPLWPRVIVWDRILSMVQIDLNIIIMQNWIVWNRTVLTYQQLSGIVWNWTAFICQTELFEIEPFLTLKLYSH